MFSAYGKDLDIQLRFVIWVLMVVADRSSSADWHVVSECSQGGRSYDAITPVARTAMENTRCYRTTWSFGSSGFLTPTSFIPS
jgi:hypothetical protein